MLHMIIPDTKIQKKDLLETKVFLQMQKILSTPSIRKSLFEDLK